MENKKILIAAAIVVLVVLIGVGAYVYKSYETRQNAVENTDGTATQETEQSISYGAVNPLENKPDVNPVEKTNPFSELKTNPFE